MEGISARDYDVLLARAIDELPAWVSERLDDLIFRVEAHPHVLDPDGAPHRITLYRQPALAQARTCDELRRLVRGDLLRAIVDRLQLEGPQAASLATACL